MEFESRRKMEVDVCRKCMRVICPSCVGEPCNPNEKWCEDVEREHLRSKIERGSWGCY